MLLNQAPFSPPIYFAYTAVFVEAYLFSVGYDLYSLYDSHRQLYRQFVARSETEYLRIQLDALQDTKENEEEVRRLRHDLGNHAELPQGSRMSVGFLPMPMTTPLKRA